MYIQTNKILCLRYANQKTKTYVTSQQNIDVLNKKENYKKSCRMKKINFNFIKIYENIL